MESKNDYELTTVPNDMLLPSYELTVEESNSDNRAARKEKSTGKCQCCMIFLVSLIAFLALCAGVAAIVLIVVYPNVTSTVPSDIQSLKDEIAEKGNVIVEQGKEITELGKQIAELRMEVEATKPGSRDNPASSCTAFSENRPSGEYWIATDSTSSPVQVYCDTNRTSCSCNTAGGWMRVANLDMTDPNQNCSEGLRLVNRTEPPLRTCGQIEGPAGCTSTTYSTYGVEYSKVCGLHIKIVLPMLLLHMYTTELYLLMMVTLMV